MTTNDPLERVAVHYSPAEDRVGWVRTRRDMAKHIRPGAMLTLVGTAWALKRAGVNVAMGHYVDQYDARYRVNAIVLDAPAPGSVARRSGSKGGPTEEGSRSTAKLQVRIDPELATAFEKAAEAEGCTQRDLMERMIRSLIRGSQPAA